MASKKNAAYTPAAASDQTSELTLKQGYVRTWLEATEIQHREMGKDYDYVDGKQWKPADKQAVESTGRPALTFNKVLPQVELVCGTQRGMTVDIGALPREGNDVRKAEVARCSLKAAADFIRLQRVTDKVADDGTIAGMGVWEVLHTYDDAEDLIWGDIVVSRINPRSFIYDPWAVAPDLQDGEFMGKASWISIPSLLAKYPDTPDLARVGEWLGSRGMTMDSTRFGLGVNLIPEIWDQQTGRVRLLTIWCKKPVSITLIADQETGQVQEVKSKADGEAWIQQQSSAYGKSVSDRYTVMTSETDAAIVDAQTGQPVQPFADAETAQKQLDMASQKAGMQVYDRYQVISRKARRPYFTEMVWWQELNSGPSKFLDRKYPYIPYISRQFSDDPASIQGIVRPIRDPQDEYNKRYNQLLGHLNSSAHSGWINRKAGGANTSELKLMGSKPGVVVEYGTVAPQRIEPSQISQGHFALLATSDANIKTTTGINNELVGASSAQTTSGRAIRARQQGGLTILQPRFRSFEEAQLDLGYLLLSRIQQYYPPEKLKRIIGVAEQQQPMGPGGQPLFAGMSDDEVIAELLAMKNAKFDLVLELQPHTPTEMQSQFEQATQMCGLVTSTGRPLGPATMNAMIEMAGMPSKLAEALKADLSQPVNPMMMEPGGQNNEVQKHIANMRGGRAGGSEGVGGA